MKCLKIKKLFKKNAQSYVKSVIKTQNITKLKPKMNNINAKWRKTEDLVLADLLKLHDNTSTADFATALARKDLDYALR